MSVPPEMFDEDYLYFMADVLGAQSSDSDAATVARLLALEPGMRVLDVPCGHGRISGRLAARGCQVVGVDVTERFLALAHQQYPDVSFERGDMRLLRFEAEFDAVVNWFTSFGYFDPDTNDQVLAGFARALRPGGRLLLELLNPWRLARLVQAGGGSSSWMIERDGNLLVERVTYDEQARHSRSERFIVRNGTVRSLEFSLEQVPAPDLIRRLRRAGFGQVELFGQGGEPFDPEGRRLIAVATRADSDWQEPAVTLDHVTRENAHAICELVVAPGQQAYVPPAAQTLVDASFDPRALVRAIYAGDTEVGLLAVIAEQDPPRHNLVRFLIGAQHQGRGFGREAIRLLAEHLRGAGGPAVLDAGCIPGPGSPAGFYRALGFEDTGRVEHGETVLRLRL